MKFDSHLKMRSHPGFKTEAAVEPIAFRASAKGAFNCEVSSIVVDVDEIPISLAVPFLRRVEQIVIGKIGGFSIKLNPFQAQVESHGGEIDGVLGTKGIRGKLNGKVDCETDMNAKGIITGRLGTAVLTLEPDDDIEDIVDKIVKDPE
jgi:hypothetical protein